MHATKEGLWLQSLITQLFGPLSGLTTLFSDNQSTITLAKDHQYHAQTKHIDVHFHFIQWIIEDGKLCLIYCPTADMVTDKFTKTLPSPKVKHFTSKLRLHNAWGGVLEEQALWSHLLMPSLLSHMSYNLILLHIVTFWSLTHYCLHAYPLALFLLYLLFLHNEDFVIMPVSI